jgi:hypothetical protein
MLGDPGLVVTLVSASSNSGRLGAGQWLSGFDGLFALLSGTGSALGLGEEGLDPGLVDKVEGATEDTGQEDIQEDAVEGQLAGCFYFNGGWGLGRCVTYIWGSKMLVGGSTMLARPL